MLGIWLEAEREIRTDISRCDKQGLELRFMRQRKVKVLNSVWYEMKLNKWIKGESYERVQNV